MESAQYAVSGSAQQVQAWSRVRLPFEPKGWLRDYRDELRSALRKMTASQTGVLLAEYATPDDDFADMENVLLYNVGSGAYSHLAGQGLICRRVRSNDGLHRVSYAVTNQLEWPEFTGSLLATVTISEQIRGHTPLVWWSAFRPGLRASSLSQYRGQFAIDVVFGSTWQGGGVSAVLKPLLDGLVSALHLHDGSSREHITSALEEAGDGPRLWRMLNDPTCAILGQRRLVRPHGARVAWNPADELCASFRLMRGRHSDAVLANVLEIERPMLPSAE